MTILTHQSTCSTVMLSTKCVECGRAAATGERIMDVRQLRHLPSQFIVDDLRLNKASYHPEC